MTSQLSPEDDLDGNSEDQTDGDQLRRDGGDEGTGGRHLYQDHPACTDIYNCAASQCLQVPGTIQ